MKPEYVQERFEIEEDFESEEEEAPVVDVDSIRQRALENRRIILNSMIDENVIETVWMQMEFMRADNPEAPVELILNCPGGATYELGFLTDYISNSEMPIATFGTGQCQSAGFILLVSGHHRVCFQKTCLMIHSMNISTSEMTMPDLKNYINRANKEEEIFYGLLADQSNFSHEEIHERLNSNKDWYMTPEEALGYGFIDSVVRRKYSKENRHPFFKES